LSAIERVHTDFLKRILKVFKKLSTETMKRAVGFWYDMILSKRKLFSIIFQISLHDAVNNNHSYNLLHFVQSIFDECGLSYIW